MKKLLKSMGLTRWILTLTLVASCVLAVSGFRLHRQRVGLERDLVALVPELAREIQVKSRLYSRLFEQAEGAGLTGVQKDVQTFLRDLAVDGDVKVGALSFGKPTTSGTQSRDVEDVKYTVSPDPRDRTFPRVNLANFMHSIEQRSRRLRVTRLRLEREGNLKPGEYGNDRWEWDIELTARQKREAQ